MLGHCCRCWFTVLGCNTVQIRLVIGPEEPSQLLDAEGLEDDAAAAERVGERE